MVVTRGPGRPFDTLLQLPVTTIAKIERSIFAILVTGAPAIPVLTGIYTRPDRNPPVTSIAEMD